MHSQHSGNVAGDAGADGGTGGASLGFSTLGTGFFFSTLYGRVGRLLRGAGGGSGKARSSGDFFFRFSVGFGFGILSCESAWFEDKVIILDWRWFLELYASALVASFEGGIRNKKRKYVPRRERRKSKERERERETRKDSNVNSGLT